MINEILQVSKIKPFRTDYKVLAYLMEEVGELSTEVNIKNGHSKKEPNKNGITEESVDVILCAIDLIYVNNPGITEVELMEVFQKKILKWRNS